MWVRMGRFMKSFALLLSASALAFTSGSAAIAQTATTQTGDVQPAAATDSSQDIVVTALRRNDKLSQTPIAASVLSGSDLANKGVVNIDALQFAVPSVVVNNFGQGLEFNVRGIGKAEGCSREGCRAPRGVRYAREGEHTQGRRARGLGSPTCTSTAAARTKDVGAGGSLPGGEPGQQQGAQRPRRVHPLA